MEEPILSAQVSKSVEPDSFGELYAFSETDRLLPHIVRPKTTPDFYRQICDKLLETCEDNDGLDIYQMTAFLRFYKDENESHLYYSWKYAFYCFKAIVCALIQTAGMVAFLYNVFSNDYDELECTMLAPLEMRILAVLFSTYISLQMVGQIRVLKSKGLYDNVAYAPPFLAVEWIYLGLYCNAFSLLVSIYGSFIIIYVADTALEIVLNSIALYFILDLDNLMVDQFDYLRVRHWMKHKFVFEEWFNDDWYNVSEGDVRFISICGMDIQISGRQSGCGKWRVCPVFFGGIFVGMMTGVGVVGAVAAPIIIAVCY